MMRCYKFVQGKGNSGSFKLSWMLLVALMMQREICVLGIRGQSYVFELNEMVT